MNVLPEVLSWRRPDGRLRLGFVKRLDEKESGRRVYRVTVRDGEMKKIAGRRVAGVDAVRSYLRRLGWKEKP